jgi:hypothetical protein
VDIATAHATFLASFRVIQLAFITLAIVRNLWCPRARRCLICALQLNRQSIQNPSHRTGLARMSKLLVTPRHFSFHFLAFSFEAACGFSPAKIHATLVLALSILNPCSPSVVLTWSRRAIAFVWKSFCFVKLITQLQSSTYEIPSGSLRSALARVRAKRTGEYGEP